MAAQSTGLSALTYGADRRTTENPARPLATTVPEWQAAADEAAGVVQKTGIDPEHFVDPLRDLFNHWAQKMNHHQPFAHTVQMMARSVFDQLRGMRETD